MIRKVGRAVLFMFHCWVRLNSTEELTMKRLSRGSEVSCVQLGMGMKKGHQKHENRRQA